jgi:hypothetical protein
MPLKRLLSFYSFPMVISSLPKQMPALTSIHIATTLGQLVHFEVSSH